MCGFKRIEANAKKGNGYRTIHEHLRAHHVRYPERLLDFACVEIIETVLMDERLHGHLFRVGCVDIM